MNIDHNFMISVDGRPMNATTGSSYGIYNLGHVDSLMGEYQKSLEIFGEYFEG